jgi:hypothetical protein
MAKRKPARRSMRSRTASKKPAARRMRTAGSAPVRNTGTAKRRPRKANARPLKALKAKALKPAKRPVIAKRPPATKTAKASRRATKAAPKPKRAARATTRRTGAPRTAAKPAALDTTVDRLAGKTPRLDRVRRTLDETVQTPPSSLDMDRRGSSVRTGRAEMAQNRENLGDMGALTRGDVDADAGNAYFSGDEAPGGDNPTPDQDIVDDIGRALGVEYQDNEELRASDKVVERDKHRWELDPASSEDYKDRK